MGQQHQVETRFTPDEALAAVARASELWGATWKPTGLEGRLDLPVLSGLKQGLMIGSVRIESAGAGARIVFDVEESFYRIRWSALFVLVLGALGGIAATLWPFFPALLTVAPLAIVVAIGAWILVASRVRTSTPEDFLELVAGDDGFDEEEPRNRP